MNPRGYTQICPVRLRQNNVIMCPRGHAKVSVLTGVRIKRVNFRENELFRNVTNETVRNIVQYPGVRGAGSTVFKYSGCKNNILLPCTCLFLPLSLQNCYSCNIKHWGQLQEILLAEKKTLNLTEYNYRNILCNADKLKFYLRSQFQPFISNWW